MNPLQDPRVIIWLGLLLLGTLITSSGAALDHSYAPQLDGLVRFIRVQQDGKAVIVGNFERVDGFSRPGVARLGPQGRLDPSFDPHLGKAPRIQALALAPDGSVYLAGQFSLENGPALLLRLDSSGAIIFAWDPSNGPASPPASLAVDNENRLVIGGSFATVAGQTAPYIARFTSSGHLDESFASVLEPATAMEAGVTALSVQGDQLLVGGIFNLNGGVRRLIRLHADGSVDPSFGFDESSLLYTHSIKAEPEATWVAGQTSAGGLCMNADGSAALAPRGVLWSVLAQAAGSALAAGQFYEIGGLQRTHLARITADGNADPAFNLHLDQPVYALASAGEGAVLLGGAFMEVDGQPRSFLARATLPTSPRFAKITCTAQNHFCTVLNTEPGAEYAIEASSDLKLWTTVQTLTASSTETEVEAPATAGRQFLRARKL